LEEDDDVGQILTNTIETKAREMKLIVKGTIAKEVCWNLKIDFDLW